MFSGSLSNSRFVSAAALVAVFMISQASPLHAEEEKKGFFSKIFGGKGEEKPPVPAEGKSEPESPEKPQPASSSPKPTTAKSTAKSTPAKSTAKTTTPAKKPETKPAAPKVADKPKEAPNPAAPTPAPKPAEKPAVMTTNVRGEVKPSASNPWHIIDIGGRDYVTLESIRNFYNPLFGFTGFREQGNHIWLMSNKLVIKAQVGSQELLMNNMKFILSFPVVTHGGKALISRLDLVKLVDPILNPSHIQGAEYFDTVVVDAGHGGHDVGARGVYGYEKDFALKMAQHLRTALMARGFKVVLTRSTDAFISLGGRVSIANQIPNSIFISLHLNSGGSTASGIETWALTPQNAAATISRGGGYNMNGTTGNKQDSANIALASAIQARVLSTVKVVDRGIKRAQWSVLTGIKKPGILFEGGFVTNAKECLLIASDNYQRTVAAAIADAVVNYRKALEPAMARR
ncbi:MAG: N-acetylmuramoyl-L-alanine amidase [Verrucomicrobiaceae bacterium]|nr:N-acetylmuramoyl-L-alanine amidase [Verrucomicrobiaceae bacterium]